MGAWGLVPLTLFAVLQELGVLGILPKFKFIKIQRTSILFVIYARFPKPPGTTKPNDAQLIK